MENKDDNKLSILQKSSPVSIGLMISFILVSFFGGMELGSVKEKQQYLETKVETLVTKTELSNKMEIINVKLTNIQEDLAELSEHKDN